MVFSTMVRNGLTLDGPGGHRLLAILDHQPVQERVGSEAWVRSSNAGVEPQVVCVGPELDVAAQQVAAARRRSPER